MTHPFASQVYKTHLCFVLPSPCSWKLKKRERERERERERRNKNFKRERERRKKREELGSSRGREIAAKKSFRFIFTR